MSDYENNERLLDEAMNGDRAALEALLAGIEDTVFNLSLRMLGSRGRSTGNPDQGDDAPFRLSAEKCLFHLGIRNCQKLFDRLQEGHVCAASAELRDL